MNDSHTYTSLYKKNILIIYIETAYSSSTDLTAILTIYDYITSM